MGVGARRSVTNVLTGSRPRAVLSGIHHLNQRPKAHDLVLPNHRQRHEDLAALPLPLGNRVFDDGHAHAVPFGQE
jgi:hypothetical protein